MSPEEKREFEEMERRLKKLESILYGLSDDNRTEAYVRGKIIVGEHTTGKPIIIDPNGKRYNLETA